MSDATIGLILIALAILGVFLLFWRLVNCIQSVSGLNMKSRERERTDYLTLIEHYAEREMVRRDNPARGLDVAHLHGRERLAKQQLQEEADETPFVGRDIPKPDGPSPIFSTEETNTGTPFV